MSKAKEINQSIQWQVMANRSYQLSWEEHREPGRQDSSGLPLQSTEAIFAWKIALSNCIPKKGL